MTDPDTIAPTREHVLESIESDPRLASLLGALRPELSTDPGHDLEHCLRVAAWTLHIGQNALPPALAIAAALLHDVIDVPKSSPDRARASEWSATRALELLGQHGFSDSEAGQIADAVRTHSYSRGQEPTSELGRALRDADRLEALGAIGLFRTISTGARMGARYFDESDPWARSRSLDDRAFSVDHFFTKLLRLEDSMYSEVGRAEAARRTRFLQATLDELAHELGRPVWRSQRPRNNRSRTSRS
jgi:uncharacterized protein